MLLEDCDMVVGESLDTDGSLSGHVYDFRLWSRALTASEVAPGLKVLRSAFYWFACLLVIFRWLTYARGERQSSRWPRSISGRLVDAFFVSGLSATRCAGSVLRAWSSMFRGIG